jgi:hypothetical protein
LGRKGNNNGCAVGEWAELEFVSGVNIVGYEYEDGGWRMADGEVDSAKGGRVGSGTAELTAGKRPKIRKGAVG